MVAALLAIVFHEVAHGFVAFLMGDKTARNDGRLSLNPLKHIDPIGALCLLVFHFGWAKPVPVNPYFFKNRKWGMIAVSLAGPLSNFLLALISVLIFCISNDVYVIDRMIYTANGLSFVDDFWCVFTQINLGLFLFNLLPIPPLDGSKVIAQFLPAKAKWNYLSFERYGGIILFVAIYFLNLSDLLGVALNFIYYHLFEWISGIFV